MWKEFQKEQFNRETLECEEGFVTYSIYDDGSCYIHIMYVSPKYRSLGIGKRLEQILIKKHNLTSLSCYVDLTSQKPEISLRAIIGAGYKVVSASSEKIVLTKVIGE